MIKRDKMAKMYHQTQRAIGSKIKERKKGFKSVSKLDLLARFYFAKIFGKMFVKIVTKTSYRLLFDGLAESK